MNWYKKSSITPTPTVSPVEPNPNEIVKDFLNGVNVEPFTLNDLTVAGVTNHYRHNRFKEAFYQLPDNIKEQAREAFGKMITSTAAVGMQKIVSNPHQNVYSVQIGRSYRALGVRVGKAYVWYWIGTHESYNSKKDAFPPEIFVPDPNYKAPKKPNQPPTSNH